MHPSVSVESLLRATSWWRRDSLLVGASGGLDSTVLLDALHRVNLEAAESDARFRLAAAYLDHGWRGAEARRDAQFLAEFCACRGIPFFQGCENVPELARRERCSLEAAGRRARYRFLASVAKEGRYAALATAHHAGDQRETLLFRLARGGCEEARVGILPSVIMHGVEIVRPLLGATPESLLAYAEERRISFREDSTNHDLRFTRNRLRKLVTPRTDPADLDAISALAALRRRLVESAATRLLATSLRPTRRGAGLPTALLQRLDSPLRRAVLRRASRRVSGASTYVTERSLDLLERLIASPTGGLVSLRRVRARVSCGFLLLQPVHEDGLAVADVAVGERGARTSLFDPSALDGDLTVRGWQPGDRLDLSYGRKKVKEIFRERRVPRWERANYRVVTDAQGPLWIVGLCRGTRAVPSPGQTVLRVTVRDEQASGPPFSRVEPARGVAAK